MSIGRRTRAHKKIIYTRVPTTRLGGQKCLSLSTGSRDRDGLVKPIQQTINYRAPECRVDPHAVAKLAGFSRTQLQVFWLAFGKKSVAMSRLHEGLGLTRQKAREEYEQVMAKLRTLGREKGNVIQLDPPIPVATVPSCSAAA